MKTLLKNAAMVADDKIIKNGFLGIDGDKIIYIGENIPADKYDIEKDMTNKLLIPGLINAHGHSAMTLLRGVGSDLPLQRWLNEAVFPIEDRLTGPHMRIGSRIALLEMISCGTTSFTDMYYFPEETIDEVCKAKIKANITRAVVSFSEDEGISDNFRALEGIELFKNYHNFDNGRIKIDFSLHAEYTNKEKLVREYAQKCKKMDARMHIHLSETKNEHDNCVEKYHKTPTRWFYDLGVFESPALAAHCVMCTDEDLDILREKNVTAVHNPTSNLKLGSGFAPIAEMLQKGLNVALGTDGAASNNNLNMFEEMHLAAIMHKGKNMDPTLISPAQVLGFATKNGAKAQGREDTGTLETGKKADICAIDLNKPHLIPNFDMLAAIVYTAQANDVCMTMCDGVIVYENGVFLTIDEEKAIFEFNKTISSLYN